jgi:prephenate dehydrogenase
LLATDDTAVTIIQSGNEVDRIVAKVAVDDLPVKIALLNPNSKKNEVICDALHLDTTLAHVILSHEIHGQQFNTALSFDPQVNLFTPAESASFYATLLDNHWIAAPDVELDATQWATRVLSALKESTARETKAEEDFSSVEFRASRKIEA